MTDRDVPIIDYEESPLRDVDCRTTGARRVGWHYHQLYASLFAAAPAGIVFGTQKKEYWQ